MKYRAITSRALLIVIIGLTGCSNNPELKSKKSGVNRRPNVVLIVADDLGYADLSCYGSETIKTRVLDTLAASGAKLTSFYAGCSLGTPSRMSLLTGAYARRLGWTEGVIGDPLEGSEGLNPRAVTIADVYKAEGYTTGIFGKWHIGDTPPLLPGKQGFDEAYYIKRGIDNSKNFYHNGKACGKIDRDALMKAFTSRAINFIKASGNKPFFLYLPYTGLSQKTTVGYASMVGELDSHVEKIITTLKESSVQKNTIVVFLSSNGPNPGQGRTPFRGVKWSALEGGYRVPCIINWPGVIPSGSVSDKLISAIDLMPTLFHACGIDITRHCDNTPHVDGFNVWATITGEKDAKHPRRELLFWHGDGRLNAIRSGKWKLYIKGHYANLGSGEPVLFDIEKDPGEKVDLSAKHKDLVNDLFARAEELHYAMKENSIQAGYQPFHKPE